MGQKKRASAARQVASSNGSHTAAAAAAPLDNAGSLPLNDVEQCQNGPGNACKVAGGCPANGAPVANGGGEEFSSVKGDCEKALVALRRGNSTKALKLIRDACNRFDSNALVQRVRGHICMRLASVIEDLTTKQRHLKEAIEAARKAVLLSPQSVEYAHFHAQLLFEAATDSRGYDEVVQECERALSIEDPVDPAKESLHEEGQHKLPTPEARIAHVQHELRGLVQKANIASISNWMKNLGNGAGEEKLRFIQMRKLAEDPMEQRVSQPKRPHEVKKSVKTPEERRKEIEVRVAAARLLQQKRECSPPHSEDGTTASAKGGQRLERRKSGGSNPRKLAHALTPEERIERLKPFWNAAGSQKRETMLEVSIDDLKIHLGSSKTGMSTEAFDEALEFAQEKKTWRFWVCCRCGERFIDSQEHAQHVMQEHIDSLPSKLRRVLPGEIDQDMADQIMDEDCRPFDGPAAIKMLIESSHSVILEESAHEPLCNVGFDCSSDASDTSISSRESRLDDLGDPVYQTLANVAGDTHITETSLSIATLDEDTEQLLDHNNSHVCNGECQRPKTVQRLVREIPTHDLPYADDDERTKLLQKVYNLFRTLIRNKCLASDHVEKIVHYATEELQSLVPDTSVQYEFNHSPLYVRFLPAQQLRRILRYLRELVHACGLDRLSEHSSPPEGTQNEEDDVIQDRLFLNEDFTMLALDERLLKETPAKALERRDGNAGNKSGKHHLPGKEIDVNCPQPLPLVTAKDGDSIPHADLQLLWIYGTAEYEYQPAGWKQFREERAHQGIDIFRALEKDFFSLQSLCERKSESLHLEEAINVAERLCIEELKKREHKADGGCQSYEAVLKKRQQELLDDSANGLSSQRKLELDMITTILRDAQTVNLPRFSYDGTLSMTSSRLSDSDDEDEDGWRVQEFIHQTDSCIEVAIQRQKEHSTSEVNKLDARILRAMDSVQRLERKLGNVSVLDYRAVVLPLVKSFLKARLEDAAEKDALEKSDAAREAFLAELSRDGKTSADRIPESSKHSREKSKDKKKSKDQRKPKDGKRSSGFGHETQQRNEMEGVVVDTEADNILEDEDGLEWDASEETRQEQEAELRRQAELEAEERKLAETLELQRRVEEEAKQKHLAELRKKQAEKDSNGCSSNLGTSLNVENCSASYQDSNSLCCESFSSDQLLMYPTPHCIAKELYPPVHEMDSHLNQNVPVDDSTIIRNLVPGSSTNTGNIRAGRNLSPSMQLTVALPTEEQLHALSPKDAKDCPFYDSPVSSLHLEPGLDFENPSNKLTTSQDSEQQVLHPSKPKRGGKNRRRKVFNYGISKEDQISQGSVHNGVSTLLLERHRRVSPPHNENGARRSPVEEGSKILGSMQTSSSSSTWKKRHINDKEGVLADNTGRTAQNGSKTLRQLKAEQDDEERFQADLEQALRQSLDFLHSDSSGSHSANTPGPLTESPQFELLKDDSLAPAGSENQRNRVEEVGKGLQNEIGQYNCFLNVVIQSLWHLRKFREELLAASSIHHVHVGDPCVVCALRDIFVGLNISSSDTSKEAVAPTTLRVALSTLYSQSDFFQEAQMNDASEVLAVVFDCLHRAFSPNAIPSDGDSDSSSGMGSWECHESTPCIVHSLFGLDIAEQMNCQRCGLESRHLKYTSFFHNINASALRTAKIMYQESSLDKLLKLVDMNHHLACDVEMGGCGRQNYIHHFLRTAPHVFTTVLGWQNNRESLEDILATVDAIETDMDVGVVYRGLDEGYKHRLVSVVCYYGQHYHCFAFNHEVGRWVMFDDTTVKVVGSWEDVADTCRKGHLQPQVLFYEAVPT